MSQVVLSERDERLEKIKELKKQGVNPYPGKSSRTHSIAEVFSDFSNLEKNKIELTLGGRIMSKRGHGNLTFAHLQDGTDKIQIAISKKDIGLAGYKLFDKYVDMGDFVEISGICFITHKVKKVLWQRTSKY